MTHEEKPLIFTAKVTMTKTYEISFPHLPTKTDVLEALGLDLLNENIDDHFTVVITRIDKEVIAK